MAEQSELEKKVVDVIVGILGCSAEQVVADAKFIEDLGADSLDCVEIIMELEEKFNLQIPDEVAETMTTVGKVFNYIAERVDDAK